MKQTMMLLFLAFGMMSTVDKTSAMNQSVKVEEKVFDNEAAQPLVDEMVKNGSTELVIPDGYTKVDIGRINNAEKILSIVLPKTITYLRSIAFLENCLSVTLHDTVQRVSVLAVLSYNELEVINIKSDRKLSTAEKKLLEQKLIGLEAEIRFFENSATVPPTLKKTLLKRHNAITLIDSAELTDDKIVNIPEGIEKIELNAFNLPGKKFPLSIVFPNSITSMERLAFNDEHIKAVIVRNERVKQLCGKYNPDLEERIFVVPDGETINAAKIDQLLASKLKESSNTSSSDSEDSDVQSLENAVKKLEERVEAIEKHLNLK